MNALSRRELLRAFLGAPFVLGACSKRRGTKSLSEMQGELALRRDKLGHRLRDLRTLPTPSAWSSCQVAVIGGGVAGLSCMRALKAQGVVNAQIFELDDALGGTAQGGQSALSAFPWGAHYVTVPMRENKVLIDLLAEVGAVESVAADGTPVMAEQFLCRDPSERLFYRGRWYEGLYPEAGSSPSEREEKRRFEAEIDRLVSFRDADGRRAFALPMSMSSDAAELRALDTMSMSTWLERHGFVSQRLRWWIEYACRDDYGSQLGDTSAWSTLLYFAARKRSPDADYQEVVTWPEGNARLVRHLREDLANPAHTGHAIASVRSHASGVEIVALRGESVVGIRAEYVVMATPQFINARVVQGLEDDRLRAAQSVGQSPWMVANIELNVRPGGNGFPLCWDNVIYQSPSLGYVVATHQEGPERGPTHITYYYPLTDSDPRVARRRLLELGWQEWAEVALSDLETAHPKLRNYVSRIDIARWGHAMVRSTPGRIWDGSRELCAQPHGRVHFAHSDLSGVALFEEAFDRGNRAANEIVERLRPS